MIPDHEVAELLKGTPYEGAVYNQMLPGGPIEPNQAMMEVEWDALQNAARAIRAERLVQELADKLNDAADSVESWGAYASDYFKEKWDFKGDVAQIREWADRAKALLNDKEPA